MYAVRSHIISTVIQHRETPVLNALADTFRFLAKHDYPDRWPDMHDVLLSHLKSGDPHRTLCSLRLIRACLYEWELKSRCPQSSMLCGHVMPTVQYLTTMLVDGNHNTIEAANAILVAFKAYNSMIKYNLLYTTYSCKEDTVIAWCGLANKLLQKQLPEPGQAGEPAGQPADPDARQEWPWWKCKKWALRAAYFLSIQESADEDEDDAAGKNRVVQLFRMSIAPLFVETILGLLIASARGGAWVSPKVKLYAMRFMQQASDYGSVWRPLKPHINTLITEVLAGVLRPTADDMREYAEDGIGWVQSRSNIFEMYSDHRNAADALLIDLVAHRGKQVLPIIEGYIGSTFQTYAAAPAASRDFASKEVAMRMLGLLNGEIRRGKKGKASKAALESMLVQHVTPEIGGSTVGILAVRAIETWAVYTDSDDISEASKVASLQAILHCLHHQDVPVRFAAAQALSSYLAGCEQALAVVEPYLLPIIKLLFDMLDEVGVDDVVTTISTLVMAFEAHLPSLAPQLLAKLSETFASMVSELEESDSEEVDMAAEAVLHVVYNVVSLLVEQDQIDLLVGPCLPPVWIILGLVFDDGSGSSSSDDEEKGSGLTLEFFAIGSDIATEVFNAIGARAASVQTAWDLAARMLRVFMEHAEDYASTFCAPLSTLVAYGPARLAGPDPTTGVDYLQLVVQVAQAVEKQADDEDRSIVSKLIITTLHFGRGIVDRAIAPLVDLYAPALPKAKTVFGKRACVLVLSACLQYNPLLTLQALAAKGIEFTATTLAYLLASCQEVASKTKSTSRGGGGDDENGQVEPVLHKSVDIKVTLLGLATLLQAVAQGAVPPQLARADVLVDFIKAALLLLQREGESAAREAKEIEEHKDRKAARRAKAESGNDGADDDDEEEEEGDDADSYDHDGDGPYMEDADDLFEDEHDDDTSTPLDHVNSLLYVEEAVRALGASPSVGPAVQAAMPPQVMAAVSQLVTAAADLRAKGAVTGKLGPAPE